MANFCTSDEGRLQLHQSNGISILLQILEAYHDHPEVLKLVIVCLTRLAVSDTVSVCIAEEGMFQVMQSVSVHVDDTAVLVLLFELLGQLAFVKGNLKTIVQYGGIRVERF